VRLARSWRHRSPLLVRYAIAAFLVFVAWAVTFTLRTSVHAPTFQTPFFVCAIVLSSWIGGFGPGILATVLSIFAVEYCVTPPFFTQRLSLSEVPKFVVFFFTGAFISWLARRQRRDEEELLRAREGLEEKVRERTADFQVAYEKLTAEVAERARAEKELHRINRVWRVRSICNRAITRSADESEVVEAGMPDYHPGRWVSPRMGALRSSRLCRPSGARRPLQHTGSHARVGYGRMRGWIVAGGNPGWQTDALQWATRQIRAPSLERMVG
jgi:K+-sensing histidine kinase KdpD